MPKFGRLFLIAGLAMVVSVTIAQDNDHVAAKQTVVMHAGHYELEPMIMDHHTLIAVRPETPVIVLQPADVTISRFYKYVIPQANSPPRSPGNSHINEQSLRWRKT